MKKKQSKLSHIKLMKKSPAISQIKATPATPAKLLENASEWGFERTKLRILHNDKIDASHFCYETLSRGTPMEYADGVIQKYRGGTFAGILLNDVVQLDTTRPGYMVPVYSKVMSGGKVSVLTSGEVVLGITAKAGDRLYLTKEGYTTKKTNVCIGVVTHGGDECVVKI